MWLALTSCSDDKKTSGTVDDIGNITMGSSYVQKGPFVQGSQISIQELDSVFIPLGRTYMTETNDDFGSFTLESELQSPIIEMTADGYYFNEVTGKIDGPIVLKMVAKIQDEKGITINILTTLAKERIKYLVTQEQKDFSEAKSTAEQEILAMFGFPESDLAGAIVGFESMNIADSGNANAMLLAASVILQGQLATGELSELISKVSNDMKTDGILSDSALKAKLKANALSIDTGLVRSHLEARYEEIGVEAVIPRFESYLDSDGDGYINKFDHNIYVGSYDNGGIHFVFHAETRPTITWGIVSGEQKYRLVITKVGTDALDTTKAVYKSDWLNTTSHQLATDLELNQLYQVVVIVEDGIRAPMKQFAIVQSEFGRGLVIDDFTDSLTSSLGFLQQLKGEESNASWISQVDSTLGITVGSLSTTNQLHMTIDSVIGISSHQFRAFLPLKKAVFDAEGVLNSRGSQALNLESLDSITFDYAGNSTGFSIILHLFDPPENDPGSYGNTVLLFQLPIKLDMGSFTITKQQLLEDSWVSNPLPKQPLKSVVAVSFSYWLAEDQTFTPAELSVDNLKFHGPSLENLTTASGAQ